MINKTPNNAPNSLILEDKNEKIKGNNQIMGIRNIKKKIRDNSLDGIMNLKNLSKKKYEIARNHIM
jgi:hypothetical protein